MKNAEIKAQNQIKDESYWKEIVQEYESSNLTRPDFCQKHQINYDNFGYWFRKLKRRSIKSFVPVKIKTECDPIAEKNKVLSTLQFSHGHLHIYDKDVLLMILNKMM